MTTARPVIYPDIGRADLDPFGGGFGMDPASSGMIFRPNFSGGVGPHFGGPGSLPRGSVPPGARFDPFGPGVVRPRPPRGGPRFGEPDPDHAAPPGADDMYF